MKRFADIAIWVACHPLEPIQVDCATTVMLKILDGKCKMKAEEKRVMARLYHAVKHRSGELFDDEMHQFIARAVGNLDEAMRDRIYEKRLLAETMISRPVMKAFKAMLRQQGLFDEPRRADSVNDRNAGADKSGSYQLWR